MLYPVSSLNAFNAFSSHFIVVLVLDHSSNEMMYTSMHAFEANAFTSPITIFFPTVGGFCHYYYYRYR
jgi:hypothetical protein